MKNLKKLAIKKVTLRDIDGATLGPIAGAGLTAGGETACIPITCSHPITCECVSAKCLTAAGMLTCALTCQ